MGRLAAGESGLLQLGPQGQRRMTDLSVFVAVSYTHLDVYKRQISSSGRCGIARRSTGVAGGKSTSFIGAVYST